MSDILRILPKTSLTIADTYSISEHYLHSEAAWNKWSKGGDQRNSMFSELESAIRKEFLRTKKGDSEGASASEALI